MDKVVYIRKDNRYLTYGKTYRFTEILGDNSYVLIDDHNNSRSVDLSSVLSLERWREHLINSLEDN